MESRQINPGYHLSCLSRGSSYADDEKNYNSEALCLFGYRGRGNGTRWGELQQDTLWSGGTRERTYKYERLSVVRSVLPAVVMFRQELQAQTTMFLESAS